MRSRVATLALAAAAIGSAIAVANVRAWDLDDTDRGVPYVRLYDHPGTQLEAVLNQGDGQAFAALAQDPLLRRPEVFRAGRAEAAYRAQRPLLGWSAWAASGGRAGLVPLMLLALSVAGFALLGAVLAWLLDRRGASVLWALPVVLSPGALVTLDWAGPETLGTAAALVGLGLWVDDRRGAAIAALVAAGLLRESLLLVPVAIAAHNLLIDRRPWRYVAPFAIPPAIYAIWVGIVWLRLDALPSDAGQGRLGAPFAGLARAMTGWGSGDVISAVLIIGCGLTALFVGRRSPAGWVAGAFVLASFLFGSEVWRRVEDYGRLLLPVLAFSVLVLVPHYLRTRAPGATSPARANVSS